MASIASSSDSQTKPRNWVDEMSKIFNRQLDFPYSSVTIFQLPKITTTEKPEAYEPQHLGLGPMHNIRLQSYKRLLYIKYAGVQRLLRHYNIMNFKAVIIEKVRNLVPMVRPCYEKIPAIDDDYMSWILSIDGTFLLSFMHSYNLGTGYVNNPLPHDQNDRYEHTISLEVETEVREIAEEIMMQENQIPFPVLKEIHKALNLSSGNDSVDTLLPSVFRQFCENHSPLKLCHISKAPSVYAHHLLDYMYCSIINNVPVLDRGKEEKKDGAKYEGPTFVNQTKEFIERIPQNEIARLYKQTVETLETFSQSKTAIPSASNLHNRAGYKFYLLREDEGIQKIDIKGKEFYLPRVSLNEDSEVIFRNLVAYEMLKAYHATYPLSEYMYLMSGLIVNVDDVKLLKKEKIIDGELPDNEVVELFVGVSGSISSMKKKKQKKSVLQRKIEEVNKVYESSLIVKMHLFLKKLAYWLLVVLRAIGGFVEASWKIVAFMFSMATIFLLTVQAYCDVYGCDKTNVTLLPYTYG